MSKTFIWIGLALGSTAGGMVPTLWGASLFSMWSVILSAIGGIIGITIGYALGRSI